MESTGANQIFAYFLGPALKLFFNLESEIFSSIRKHSSQNCPPPPQRAMVRGLSNWWYVSLVFYSTASQIFYDEHRVAPILPMSFCSRGDVPVLTKRTFWSFLHNYSHFGVLLEILDANHSEDLGWCHSAITFVCQFLRSRFVLLRNFHTLSTRCHINCTLYFPSSISHIRFNQSTMMNKTCTIKYRSTMTNKLVRLPDSILVEPFFNINWYNSSSTLTNAGIYRTFSTICASPSDHADQVIMFFHPFKWISLCRWCKKHSMLNPIDLCLVRKTT